MNRSAQLEEEIFNAALLVPPAERSRFVFERCGDDTATAERVLGLVDGYERNSTFLEAAVSTEEVRVARAFAANLRPEPRPGDRIGRYLLLERIGEGGFSVVFRAEQSEPVRRQVALKILRLGMDTHEFIARFEAERQALALMDHPNVARVFDAGATATGRPYLVMELIAGVPITTYCDQHDLTIGERLQLFRQVCAALQHAHQKGIIHRDLKPSNVLVTDQGGAPQPKLIDFGIAKATRTPLTERTLVTVQHALIGTPAYTSPEQMDIDGSAADTRSDVYSLGALLYELLTGCPPFDRDVLQRAKFDELRRLIREVEPPRASQRLAALAPAEQKQIAAGRQIEVDRLVTTLRTDLDWIVRRCLEKDPARRYATAHELALDLQRYQEDEPVLARPPSRTYQICKFVRRHRTPVLAAAVVLVALVCALLATRVSLARETLARNRAVLAERAQADLRREAEQARVREARRAGRAIIDLAEQRLAQGRTAEALAYFVHAAEQDPGNAAVAPRLASILTSRSFLLPEGLIAQHPSPVLAADYSDDGQRLIVVWRDGAYATIDLGDGAVTRHRLPTPLLGGVPYLPTRSYLLIYCGDSVIRTLDRQTGNVINEIRFEADPLGCQTVPHSTNLVTTKLSSNVMMLFDATAGRMIGSPVPYEGMLSAGPKWLAWIPEAGRSASNRVRLRRTDTPDQELDLTLPVTVTRDRLVTSPDGRRMVTLHREGLDQPYQLKLWSLPAAEPLGQTQILGRSGWLFFSPDGRRVACWGQGIDVFDSETLARIAHLPAGNFIDQTKLEFSPDGRTLVTWGNAERVDLWDLETGQSRMAPLQHGGNVATVAFSRDGRILLTTSDGLARIWDVRTGELLAEPTLQLRGLPAVALSPDGTQVTIGTNHGDLYRFGLRADAGAGMESGATGAQPLRLPRVAGLPAPFLPGLPSRVFWMSEADARTIEVASGQELGRVAFPEPIRRAQLRRDGRVLVVQTVSGTWQGWWLGQDAVERVVPLQEGPSEDAWAIFSPALDRVVLSGARWMRTWELNTGQPIGPSIAATVSYTFAQYANFSPDGRRLLLGSVEGQARIWNPETGQPLVDFGDQPTNMTQALFSPDGRIIVSGSRMSAIRFWSGTTGEPLGPLYRQPGMWGQGVFTSDSRLAATFTFDRMVALRDPQRGGAAVRTIEVMGALRSVRFSPDDSRLATGTDEGTAQVWEVARGLPVTEPFRHGLRRVDVVEFSPDGRFVRTETRPDSGFFFWSVPPAPPPGEAAPSWLLDLAILCAGKRVGEDGQLEDDAEAGRMEAVRAQVTGLPNSAPYAEWGRWFFADPARRPLAPGFSISRADAQRRFTTTHD